MKKVQNILTEKQAQLTTLVNQSDDAISLITQTVSRLENVNAQIEEKRQEIDTYRSELSRLDDSMGKQFEHNAKMIGKFRAFLED